MSDFLLDTHVWIWYAEGVAEKLDPKTEAIVERALREHRLYVSAVSVWEIGLLMAKSRIVLSAPVQEWIHTATALPGLRLRPLGAGAALESTMLPDDSHGDQADRFLIAEARVGGLTLLTSDRKILDYGKAGHVRVLAA